MCPPCRNILPVCSVLITSGEFFESCAASFYYKGLVRNSILRYKFSGRRSYASVYAGFLAQTIEEQYHGGFDVISWVPVSKKRLKKRGYDQAQLLCEKTAKKLGLVPRKALIKTVHNTAQSELSGVEKRRANVLSAYEIEPDFSPLGKRILLIDDIMTTGATLSECARTLLMAGADSVLCAVLAYAGRT